MHASNIESHFQLLRVDRSALILASAASMSFEIHDIFYAPP